MPEDPIYKTLLREFLPDFLSLFFPEVATRLDFNTVQFLDREEFSDLPAGSRREVDVLALVKTLAGEPELILLHVEVQARRQEHFGERMWRYYSLLSLRHPYPVCPLALLVYSGVGGVGWDSYKRVLFEQEVLCFRFGRVGLLDLRDEDYLIQNYPLAIALAARMRHPGGSALAFKLRCAEQLERVALNPAQKRLLVQAVDHFLVLSSDQEEVFHRLVAQRRLQEVRSMLTGSERLGVTKGIVQGKQELWLDLFQVKFGKAPPALRKRIRGITDPKVLTKLARRLVTAKSPTELEDLLPNPSRTNGE
jgi:hypothetical protein